MYIIGDIHGCFLTLQKLVEKIGKNEVFYSVGDIVDVQVMSVDIPKKRIALTMKLNQTK